MAISAFPFDGQDTTEAQYSTFFRELQDSGVIGGFGDASLRVTADSTGMQVKIAPGSAILRGHCVISTAIETRAIGAAATQPRIDAVVARLDPATDNIVFIVLPGAPATNPAPPTLQQTDTGQWDLLLALVTVAAGTATIAAGAVAERRPWIGQRVGSWSTDTRPTAPRRGRLGLNTTTNSWEWHNGTGWVDLAPTVTWASITGKPSTFTPSGHTHAIGDISGLSDAFAYRDSLIAQRSVIGHTHSAMEIPDRDSYFVSNGNASAGRCALTWSGGRVQMTIGVTHVGGIATDGDISALQGGINAAAGAAGSAQATANAAWGGLTTKADGWEGDNSAVRYSHGPHSSGYNRQAGNNRVAAWMDDSLVWGRATSSLRYKDHVSEWDIDEAALLSITPKTFHRKVDAEGEMDYGAIAEEVHDAGLDWLVYYDEEGRPDALKDHLLPWALLGILRTQHAQIAELTARLDAQEAQG